MGVGKRVGVVWVCVLMTLPNLHTYIYIRLTLYLRDGNCFEGGTKSSIYVYAKIIVLHICISMWLIMSMMDLFKLW